MTPAQRPLAYLTLWAAALVSTGAATQPLPASAPAGMPPGPPPGAAAPDGPPGGPPGMPPMMAPEPLTRIALAIDEAHVHRGAVARVQARSVTPEGGRQVRIVGTADQVNGLVVQGRARFTLADSTIDLAGKGKNDFAGIAAGALAKDDAALTLRRVTIVTRGIVSSAVTATDRSTLHVQHARLVAMGGAAPSGYVRRIGPGMMEPPTPLGIVGTARTTLVMGSAHATYDRCHIEADGWGAMSTDAARGATLVVNDSRIVVRRSGYGAYADNGASVTLNRSVLDVATFGGVIAGQATLAMNDVTSLSRGNTVMIHSVMGSGTELATLTLEGGALASTNAAILVKSANADITIKRTRLRADNGDLLLAVVNDDTHRSRAAAGVAVPGTRAHLRQTRLQGNVLNLDTERALAVAFVDSTLEGRIHEATVSLDERSRWIATADSKVTLAAPFDLARVDARSGVTIEAAAGNSGAPRGRHALPGGGTLLVR